MMFKKILANPIVLGIASLSIGGAVGIGSMFVYKKYYSKNNATSTSQTTEVNMENVDTQLYQTPTTTSVYSPAQGQENQQSPTPSIIKYKTVHFKMQGYYNVYSYDVSFKIPALSKVPIYKEVKDRIEVNLDDKTAFEVFLAPEAYVTNYLSLAGKVDNTIFGQIDIVQLKDNIFAYTNKVLATKGYCNGIDEKIPAPCGYTAILSGHKLEDKYPAIISVKCKSRNQGGKPNLNLCNIAMQSMQMQRETEQISFQFSNNGKKLNIQSKVPLYCEIKKQNSDVAQVYDLYCNNIKTMSFQFGPGFNNVHYQQLLGLITNTQLGAIQNVEIKDSAGSGAQNILTYVLKKDISTNKKCAPIAGNLINPPCGPNQLKLSFKSIDHMLILCDTQNNSKASTICADVVKNMQLKEL